jgi:hypothetical protein
MGIYTHNTVGFYYLKLEPSKSDQYLVSPADSPSRTLWSLVSGGIPLAIRVHSLNGVAKGISYLGRLWSFARILQWKAGLKYGWYV